MNIITRYLLRAFLGPLLLCFVCFNAIYIIFDLFGHINKFIDLDASAFTILMYYGGLLSMYSHWFIPASCMLATLYTMWQLSRHSELTALRASGVSFLKLTAPFLAVALCASAATLLNSELITPTASVWSDQFRESNLGVGYNTRLKTKMRYVDLTTTDTWTFDLADASNERTMAKPTGAVSIERKLADEGAMWELRADRAEFLDGAWWFWNPREYNYTIDDMGGGKPEYGAASSAPILPTPMRALALTPRDIVLDSREWDFFSLSDMRRYLRAGKKSEPGDWHEYYSRLVAPWACVVITIFAIPAGISTGRQSMIKGVILALGSFFGFYALTLAMTFIARHGVIAPLPAAIIPSLVFLVIGIVSFKRLV